MGGPGRRRQRGRGAHAPRKCEDPDAVAAVRWWCGGVVWGDGMSATAQHGILGNTQAGTGHEVRLGGIRRAGAVCGEGDS